MKIEEIENDILSKLPIAVEIAQEEVYTIMENTLKQFYADYSPVKYERTFQLMKSCVKTSVVKTANGATAEVYFDSGMMAYSTGAKPSGSQVLDAANAGLHGAMDLRTVPGSVALYPQAEESVARYIMPIMKDALISAGIKVI